MEFFLFLSSDTEIFTHTASGNIRLFNEAVTASPNFVYLSSGNIGLFSPSDTEIFTHTASGNIRLFNEAVANPNFIYLSSGNVDIDAHSECGCENIQFYPTVLMIYNYTLI